jgi:hypothetical protein
VDARVNVLAIEVRAIVRGRDLNVDRRMQRVKGGKAWYEPADREHGGQLQAQQVIVGALLQLAGGVIDLVQRTANRARR